MDVPGLLVRATSCLLIVLMTYLHVIGNRLERIFRADLDVVRHAVRVAVWERWFIALAYAFLHAQATRVEVRLEFEVDAIRLSVSDDGIGLPENYAERGRGFSGMEKDAEE